jgi:hypothetical protein
MGYLLVGTSLFTLVHPSQVYLDPIFLRLFFAFGSSAFFAMVTAILPQIAPYSHASTTLANGKIAGLAGFLHWRQCPHRSHCFLAPVGFSHITWVAVEGIVRCDRRGELDCDRTGIGEDFAERNSEDEADNS